MNIKHLKIVAVCGRICSGKTYTANLISKLTGFPVASFGGYLKYYCEKNSLPIDRKTLQDIGEKFIETMPQKFLDDVIFHYIDNSNSLVIEGVRHISIFELIYNLSETKIGVFVEADLETRYKRYCNRIKDSDDFKTFEQFLAQDMHPVELETQFLKSKCSVIIDSTLPFEENLNSFEMIQRMLANPNN